MGVFKKLFQQTFIYGLATVLPRALGIVLVPLYVSVLGTEQYGIYAALMAFLVLGNVLLSYGMETAFFRFINKHPNQRSEVQATALVSLTVTTLLFVGMGLLNVDALASLLDFRKEYIAYALGILGLDALVVLPFVWFRANEQPKKYAIIKIANVAVNLGLNLFFFLALPDLAKMNTNSLWASIYLTEHQVTYVFVSNAIASGLTLLVLLPLYVKIGFGFNRSIWKEMMKYALPVLVAGIAFSINEAFDKILLRYMLPKDTANEVVGVYAACYKLGVFMTLFATAFRLGIEPFFFNHAASKNAKQTYATITQYFTIFGSVIFLFVMVFIDLFKRLLIPDPAFWVALEIVPLILLANLCLGIYHNFSVWYKVTDRTRYGAWISLAGAALTLGLNILLIPLIGYFGSAWATLAAYGTMMVLSFLFGQKYYAVPYNIKKMAGYVFLSIAFGMLSFYRFEGNFLISSVLLLVFLCIVFYFEKNPLQRMLQR
ncbi:oligosaccharide flippase family protein [Altibacter sp. HG106]|uniref:oligosaccharide flippase family protein n=1 Tax=Altibacter sp. HG106 TaxID=3023937 RepID=UPI00235000E3|nr:oligosaccharide flippase family protein [Altibacter sp. HG106]MDC7995034.1 oligosaccharide flippase family protein [Altibacter sp. HG106]